MKPCPNCQKSLSDNATTCPSCGHKFGLVVSSLPVVLLLAAILYVLWGLVGQMARSGADEKLRLIRESQAETQEFIRQLKIPH